LADSTQSNAICEAGRQRADYSFPIEEFRTKTWDICGFRGESFGLTLVIQSMDDFSVFRQGSFGQAKAAAILVRCRLRRFLAPHERKPISPRG
jgi:hypothetical protein